MLRGSNSPGDGASDSECARGHLKCYKGKETREEERTSPRNHAVRFSLAKRLRAENLRHQPLPDKLEDGAAFGIESRSSKEVARSRGPALGCKKPETRMDLAICWETPIDPAYEPPRAARIDGSEGGAAPAIFTLVRAASASASASASNSSRLRTRDERSDFEKPHFGNVDENREAEAENEGSVRCCCKHLSKCVESLSVSRKAAESGKYDRKKMEIREPDPRLIRSAVGIALGIERNNSSRIIDIEREERPRSRSKVKSKVPRPRTPFARRSFSIDTLTPPFSVVDGTRDTDYPEHWRLLSVYQQSYRNPTNKRRVPR